MSANPKHIEKPLLNDGFQLLESELAFAMESFGAMLARLGHRDLAGRLPWSGKPLTAADGIDRGLGQAYSIAFQLLNIVEERVAAQVRRWREKAHGPAAEKGLWPDKLAAMRHMGLDAAGILEVLRLHGLVRGTWTFDTHEQLSPGQGEALARLSVQYPELTDHAFVAARLDEFLR